jgi:uncharacterized protein (DUF2336 family)
MIEEDNILSFADVQRLAGDRSAQARISVVAKLIRTAEAGLLDGNERDLARDLLRRLAHDAALQVREAVAWQIYNSPLLSDDVAHTLALDVASVAFPLLRHADDLAEQTLMQVIAQGHPAKQAAIAARKNVSSLVSDALANVENLAVLATLAANAGADLSEASLQRLADRYAHVPMVAEPLAERLSLPPSVIERLVAAASARIAGILVERHNLSPVIAAEMSAHARDRVISNMLLRPLQRHAADLEILAVHLDAQGRLGVPLLLRVLCAGDLHFFAIAMSVRSGIGIDNVQALLWHGGDEGAQRLLELAHLPRRLFKPFIIAMQVAREQPAGWRDSDSGRADFQTAALARVYLECGQSEERAMDDLLLQLFDQKNDALIDRAMDMAGLPFIPLRGVPPASA